MNDESILIDVAMQIILHAGDARIEIDKGLKNARNFKFDEAFEYLKRADEYIKNAHKIQTKIIQNEASGNHYDPCLLFTHAQDTIMTVMTEYKMAKEMILVLQTIETKMERLCKNV